MALRLGKHKPMVRNLFSAGLKEGTLSLRQAICSLATPLAYKRLSSATPRHSSPVIRHSNTFSPSIFPYSHSRPLCCIPTSSNMSADQLSQLKIRQSPINISQGTAKFQDYRPFTLLGHENLSLSSGNLTVTNTGTTIKCLAKPGTALLQGGPLNVNYEFVEMHFHWGDVHDKNSEAGSEHTIDNKSYPLELHMVHKNVHDASVGGALAHENGICVLGFLFTVIKDDSDLQTMGMDALTNIVKNHLQGAGSKFGQQELNNHNVPDVNVANFVPLHLDEYFHYRGSLTTGGCEEAVNWVVFRNPVAVRESHLKAMQSIMNDQGKHIVNNYRQTMPVYQRPLYYKGERLMDLNVISKGSSVGLRSQQNAEIVDEDMVKHLKI